MRDLPERHVLDARASVHTRPRCRVRGPGGDMSRRRAAMAISLLLALAAPGRAAAEPPPEAQELEARALGDEGLHRFNAARWQDAYDLFQRADTVFHAPTLV